jgi:hypothetical protein
MPSMRLGKTLPVATSISAIPPSWSPMSSVRSSGVKALPSQAAAPSFGTGIGSINSSPEATSRTWSIVPLGSTVATAIRRPSVLSAPVTTSPPKEPRPVSIGDRSGSRLTSMSCPSELASRIIDARGSFKKRSSGSPVD